MILFITLAWTAILMGSWLGWQLLRQNGRLLLRLEELERYLDELELGQGEEQEALPVGSDAPRFDLPDLAGDRKSLDQYRGQPLLLIFFNPACGFCRDLVPKLEGKAENGKQKAEMGQSVAGNGNLGEPPKVLIVSTGDATSHRTLFDRHKNECPVLLQKEMEVTAAYRAEGTPSGYLISAEGRIASPLAKGADALLKLFEGLVPQIAPVHQEKDATRPGEFDQTIDQVDGREGLA